MPSAIAAHTGGGAPAAEDKAEEATDGERPSGNGGATGDKEEVEFKTCCPSFPCHTGGSLVLPTTCCTNTYSSCTSPPRPADDHL